MKRIEKSRNKNTFSRNLLYLLFLGLMIATTGCEDTTIVSKKELEQREKESEQKLKMASICVVPINRRISTNRYGTSKFQLINAGCDLKSQTIVFKTYGEKDGQKIERVSYCKTGPWTCGDVKDFEIGDTEFIPNWYIKKLVYTVECDGIKKDFTWKW